jgi:hypothetical protein
MNSVSAKPLIRSTNWSEAGVRGRERRVRRRLHEEADVALVLDRRELALGDE